MSQFRAEVVRIGIEPHQNADRLEVARVRGWACVVQKGAYSDGDLAVYIPPDAVLPDTLVKAAGVEKYYNKRLRTQKLRGVVSQGLVIPLGLPGVEWRYPTSDGDDVTDLLGITKWEEPIPVRMAGNARPQHPLFQKYTDIENIKNFPSVLVPGEEVVVTEKVHGSHTRAAILDGELHVGSHLIDLIEDQANLYWRAATELKLQARLAEGDLLFGEAYGSGVQDLSYGKTNGNTGIVLFDAILSGKYLDFDRFANFLTVRGLDGYLAPLLYRGPWDPALASLADGKSELCPEQIREGIVIKPVKERWDDRVGRVIIKVVSEAYLLRRDATERH